MHARLALEKADQQKDEFLAMLVHELRNPLAPIDTASQLLTRLSPVQDSRSQASVAVIRRQVRHLTPLVDDREQAARGNAGRRAAVARVWDRHSPSTCRGWSDLPPPSRRWRRLRSQRAAYWWSMTTRTRPRCWRR